MKTIKPNTTKINAIRIHSDLRSGMACGLCKSLCDNNYTSGIFTPEQYEYCKSSCEKNHC